MVKLKIQKELLNMGFNPIHIGTEYLTEAIYIIYKDNKSMYNVNLEKDIYTKLEFKYKKNRQTIKSNIIKATNATDIFNPKKISDLKLTPKLVMWEVIEKINS